MTAGEAARSAEDAAAVEHAQSLVGHVIAGRYRIDEIVAMGGMGAVFRGEHVHMRKRVAIKVLHPETQGLPELVTRFERESVVGAHAEHPNVASASDFGKLDDGTYYLVLEYIDGITLHELMKRGPIPAPRALDIARQIARALSAVHKIDIFHRDMKPRNVMIVEGPPLVVKLIDFGFAKVPLDRFSKTVEESMRVTVKGTVFGTIGYIAPEAAHGMHAVTDRSDLYALGVMLYEMLTGVHPWDDKDPRALFHCHLTKKPPPFRERAPDRVVPEALEAVTMRLLEKAPEDRFESAAAVVEALDDAASGRKPKEAKPAAAAAPKPLRKARPAAPGDVPFAQVAPGPKAAGRLVWFALAALAAAGGVLAASPDLRARALAAVGVSEGPAATTPSATPAPPAVDTAASAPGPASSAAAGAGARPATEAPGNAEPRPTSIDGLDAATWRRVLHESVAASDATRGAKALLALAQIDPDALRETSVIAAAATVAVGVELGDRAVADGVYEMLASERAGQGGSDVLFHVTSFYGGSRGAWRAGELLRRPEVLARASPGLRIAMDLRDAPCKDKVALLERAGQEGDDRALAQMSKMRDPGCQPSTGICCMPYEPKLDAAIAQIRARVQR